MIYYSTPEQSRNNEDNSCKKKQLNGGENDNENMDKAVKLLFIIRGNGYD